MTELRLASTAADTLQEQLLQEDGRERVAFAYCTPSNGNYLVEEIHAVTDDEHYISEQAACRPDCEVERFHIGECTSTGRHPLVIHSHPFSDDAWFSSHDDNLMNQYRDWLKPLFPDTDLLFGVLGQNTLHVKHLTDSGDYRTLPVTVVGSCTQDSPLETRDPEAPPAVDWKRHDRSIRAYGLEAIQSLEQAHVAVVGCGGIGSHLAVNLARLGIGQLTIIDPDDVERSNLPRIAGARPNDVGIEKVAVVHAACWEANPDVHMTNVYAPVQDAADQLKQADLIIAGVDNLTARYWLNEFAATHLLPYIDCGTRIELDEDEDQISAEEQYVQVILPGVTGCFDCLGRGDPEQARREQLSESELMAELEAGYIAGTDLTPEPAVLPLNLGAVADGLAATVDVLTGTRNPPGLLHVERRSDTRTGGYTHPSQACITCGPNGVLARGDAEPRTDELDDTPLDEPEEGALDHIFGTADPSGG